MEDEWNMFLEHTEPFHDVKKSSVLVDPRDCNNYKAYLCIGRGNRCDIGTFETLSEASIAYDAYAISRRRVGLLLKKELHVRKRVKARRFGYEEAMKASIMYPNKSIEASENAIKATLDFQFKGKCDGNFASVRVYFPELNNFPSINWDVKCKDAQPLSKVLRFTKPLREQQALQETLEVGTKMQEQPPPRLWLKLTIDDIVAPMVDIVQKSQAETDIDTAIDASKKRLLELTDQIVPEYEEVVRLTKLEECGRQLLIDEQNDMNDFVSLFRSLCK